MRFLREFLSGRLEKATVSFSNVTSIRSKALARLEYARKALDEMREKEEAIRKGLDEALEKAEEMRSKMLESRTSELLARTENALCASVAAMAEASTVVTSLTAEEADKLDLLQNLMRSTRQAEINLEHARKAYEKVAKKIRKVCLVAWY